MSDRDDLSAEKAAPERVVATAICDYFRRCDPKLWTNEVFYAEELDIAEGGQGRAIVAALREAGMLREGL